MSRHQSACPTRSAALSTHVRAGLLGLGSLAMVACGGGSGGAPPASDTRPSVTLSKLNNALEGQPANFRVSLSATAGGVVTVTYNTLNPVSGTGGTCGTGGADYASANSATVDIMAGQTTADFSIATCPDSTVEGTESFDVQLSAVSPETTAKLSTTASELRQTAAILNTTATGKLNDTGIVNCGTPGTAATLAHHDCMNGRDYAAQQGTLSKVGSSTPNNGQTNGFDFTKIGSNGQPLAIQNGTWDAMGSEAAGTMWDCVHDNVTGLLWENKSDNATPGLRDKGWTYTWYNSNPNTNGGNAGVASSGSCYASGRCDTEKFVADVNTAGLCGYNDWRMPTVDELQGIVDMGRVNPAIDTSYFPNTQSYFYWSGSPAAPSSDTAWFVYFNGGLEYWGYFVSRYPVRLVRGY